MPFIISTYLHHITSCIIPKHKSASCMRCGVRSVEVCVVSHNYCTCTTIRPLLVVDVIGCGIVSGGDEGHGAAAHWTFVDRLE
jgi:hypothetical protein